MPQPSGNLPFMFTTPFLQNKSLLNQQGLLMLIDCCETTKMENKVLQLYVLLWEPR